jgi:phospholipase A1
MAWSDTPPPAEKPLARCAAIGPAADRLLCYDNLAGRAPSAPVPLAPEPGKADAAPVSTSLLAPKDTPTSVAAPQEPRSDASVLSRYWELEPQDKRGTFNLTGYRPNYVLPVHATSRINRSPQSPTQATVPMPAYRTVESKFQLSFRTKALQDVGLNNADLWLAFTQQTLWQIWNGKDSKPFRNTDYQPEAIYVVPVPRSLQALPAGWKWRYAQFGLAHESNGQADPLSRSWNRVYLGSGFERGDWSLTARVTHRLSEDLASDNNPDLVSYRGRTELQGTWSPGVSTVSMLYRSTLKDLKFGALQLEWTYPVFRDQPNGVRYLVQAYRGYGETLTDYNFRQTSLGVGLSFMQF